MNLITIIILVLPVIIFYSLYVSVITKRNKVQEALSGIDVQLKKRFDLVPNILHIAKRFMEHERSLFEEITELRTRISEHRQIDDTASAKEKFNLENMLQSKMGQLIATAENYPQLKSDQTMLQAMKTYNEVEEHIAAARRFYNSAITELKNTIQIFPGNIIAAMVNVKDMPYFETDEASKAPVTAANYL